MQLFYVDRKRSFNLSGLHTGRCHRPYVLKDGEYIAVPFLGGGGGTTELETRLSSVDTALSQQAAQSALTSRHEERLGGVEEKAPSHSSAVAHNTLHLNIGQNAGAPAVSTLESTLQASIDTKAGVGLAHRIQAQVDITVVTTGMLCLIRTPMSL